MHDVIVRTGRYEDIVGICRTIESARVLMKMELPPAEYPYAMHYSLDIIAQGLCWVAEADSKIVGVAMLDRRTWPWAPSAKFLENIHLWVEPGCRKGGTAAKFIEKMKARAKELNLPLSLVLTFPDGCEQAKDRFARMQGFRYMGGSYWCK
jgi:GNAT superfamily N-acetyltransferase